LRELLGEEEFNNFCKQVWKTMTHAERREWMGYNHKSYVYNQKVSEEDMIAAAEEYVAHLAETPMFAEYLRNRNEQEAVSWINKKWKKVCDLIRKIFKKRTGEELLSSDESIMDALYRSYQLLGSNDYAMFDYYRSLTEQMRKEDVKVGEINEEEIFSKGDSNTTAQELQSIEEQELAEIKAKAIADGTFLKAPNGKPTNLTESQWLHVRTKAFKKWFGDWEGAYRMQSILSLKPEIVTEGNISKEKARELYDAIGTIKNKDGRAVEFVKNSFGKIVRHKGYDTKRIMSKMAEIFKQAEYAFFETELLKEGHKDHSSNYVGYHHYVGKFSSDGKEYFIRFTVVETKVNKSKKKAEGFTPHKFHSSTITDVGIYENTINPSVESQGTYLATGKNDGITDAKLQSFFKKANNSSKIVDENGEPKVVYHGTSNGKFNVFDKERIGEKWNADEVGFFFTDSEAIGKEYTSPYPRSTGNPHLFNVYLNIEKPLLINSKWYRRAYGRNISKYDAIEVWDNNQDEILESYNKGNFDGVIIDTTGMGMKQPMMMVAFEPSQIKSATENVGTYDANNPDIRFSRITPEMDASYLDAVERGDMETAQRMVDEVAERTGYNSSNDYQGSLAFNGAAPSKNGYYETKEERKQAWDNGDFEGEMSLGDFVDSNIDTHDLQWNLNDPRATMNEPYATVESIRNLRNTVRDGKRTIKMYRAVDADIKENSFRNGDWVTPSRAYAKEHASLNDWEHSRIIEQEVSIDDIWWNGDDINEWGFDDGKGYGYQNTKNNRKLLDAVTYDDNGNVIPLSERFNEEKEDIRFSRSKSVAEVNSRFNEELQKQIDGTLPKGHIYQLGIPSDILRSCGFPDIPIELSSTNLAEHARKTHHSFELKDVKDLVNALQEPIGVFAYGDKEKSQNVIVEIQKNGRNFLVGVHFNQNRNGLEVSSIRGIFPKDNAEWLIWINQGKSLYLDKEKIQDLIDKQRKTLADVAYLDLDSVANVIKDFENPSIESENSSSTQEQGTIIFSKGKPAGYVNLSNKFKPQKQPMSALVAREQAVANAVMEWFREMVGAENIVTNVRAMTDVYINALNNGERIRVLHTSKKGEDVILGFEHNGVHYLDMGAMDSGLLLYELGTVWVDILKKNDALWERAKEVCRSTKEYKSLVNTAAYKRGEVTEEDVVKEVLAYHISELGTRLGNNLNVSNDIKEEFEYKVGFAFAELKNTLSRFDEYELSKLGVEDFARLSLRDIVLNTSMADSEAVVSDLEDSSEDETPTDKRVKHGTYLRYAPRKKETTGEYLERLQKDRYWNEASLYGQADVDIAIAVLQSAVEKEMGGQIPEALDVYNMIDSFDSAAYNKINSFENNVAKPYKKLLRKLGKQLKKHPDIKSLKISRLDSIYWYMQAKDIVERQQIDGIDRGRKGLEDALGMSLERYIGLVEGFLGNESINQLWDETNSITDNILMMYKQLGEINDTDIASMKRRFYVPEIGFVDDKNKDGVSGRFAGRQVAPLSTDNKHQIKKSKGRGNSIADSPFYNMIDGSISLIYEIEKRKVQDALIGLAEYAMLNGVDISKFFVLNNEGGLLHDKSKGGSIKVGSPKDASYVYFNEQNNLGKTLQNAFSTSSKKGKYDGVVLWWKNFMSNSYTTWKLAFVFKNLRKDIKATLATATIKYGIGVPAKVSKNLWLKGLWWSVLKYNFNGSTKSKYGDLIKQYYESGAGTGYAELRHEKKLRQLESSAFERKYFNPFTYIELLADLSEGMPRIALYKAMLDSGYTEHSAKIAARNATINFGRQAGGVVADIATTAIPFYRASTSGGEGWLRTLTTRGEEKTSITNHLLRASLTLTSFFAVGVLMALADDEDDDDTDYDEWTDYLLRVNDSPYLGQDRMYVGGVVPSYFAQNHTPFVQAGYDFVRMLQDEKSGYDISVDFITNLLTSTIAANELQQLPVSLTRSIITDESLGDAITKQAIKMSDINPISKIARAWVGIDDFGNKRYENKNKSGYGNASGDAAYIYRKIADYAASTSDMQHPEKAKEQYIGDNGEIQERKLNWVQDINSDKLEDVTNALLPFMEGFISSVSNAAEQLIEREEFDWLEFTKETPVINKVFYNTPKTNLEKLESGYKLMNRYINSYIQGEGDFGSKELKENNKYLRMNAFDDTTDYKERLEEYEYYIKNYKGNEDIVKKIVERDIKTWKRRRKEMFGN
jgi:hypothetical protein